MDPLIDQKKKDEILSFVTKQELGASLQEIAEALKINRITLAKYLSSLHAEGIIRYRNVGMAKLWHVETNPLLRLMLGEESDKSKTTKIFLHAIGEVMVVYDKHEKIIWLNNQAEKFLGKLKQVKGKKKGSFASIKKTCALSQKVLQTKKAERTKIQVKGKNYLLSVSPITSKDGEVVGNIELYIAL